MSNHPWFKEYPREWLGNPAIRSVSPAARGLLQDVKCLMHEARPYGHLLINGAKVTDDVVARILGYPVESFSALLAELLEAGLLNMNRAKVVSSPQMIAQHATAQKGAAAVEKRWRGEKPARTGRDNSEINAAKQVRSAAGQVTEPSKKSPRPNRVSNRDPITHISEDRSQISNNIDPTPLPRDAPPDGGDGPTFPAKGTIKWSEPWASIARASGKGIDIDLLAYHFRRWCKDKKIPLDVSGIEQKFATFVEKHEVR